MEDAYKKTYAPLIYTKSPKHKQTGGQIANLLYILQVKNTRVQHETVGFQVRLSLK